MIENGITQAIRAVLDQPSIQQKLDLAARIAAARNSLQRSDSGDVPAATPPARPDWWQILPALQTPERPDLTTARGRFSLLHSVAHIEVSAVELALMAVVDFPGQELQYYRDMLRIAAEEVEHARMLLRRLSKLGGELGQEPVHMALWQTAAGYSALADRLAVVPRILEAKGLDVSAKLRGRLRSAGDAESASALDRIYHDEIGHVAIGTKWYRRVCERHGLDSEQHFLQLAAQFRSNRPVPFDPRGRQKAGFTVREMEAILGRKLPQRYYRQSWTKTDSASESAASNSSRSGDPTVLPSSRINSDPTSSL